MKVDRLLEKMDIMFNQPLSRLERKRLFESRVWVRREGPGLKSFGPRIASPRKASKDGPKPGTRGLVRCYQCDKVGHYAKDCLDGNRKRKESSRDKKIGQDSRRADRQVKPG
ncbi:gag protein [Lasius niger]|uniref:Gag protein n=1 Tax=Lasius niger TaxID=67767 RepID=A0A0J7KJL0_LASNI|nr:gag protein [Lasius niger]